MKLRSSFLIIALPTLGLIANAQQAEAPLKDTLLWMHNFAADTSSQYTGQDPDNKNCTLGTPNCQRRHDVSTFDGKGCSADLPPEN